MASLVSREIAGSRAGVQATFEITDARFLQCAFAVVPSPVIREAGGMRECVQTTFKITDVGFFQMRREVTLLSAYGETLLNAIVPPMLHGFEITLVSLFPFCMSMSRKRRPVDSFLFGSFFFVRLVPHGADLSPLSTTPGSRCMGYL